MAKIVIELSDDVYKALKEEVYPIPNPEKMAVLFKVLVNKGTVLKQGKWVYTSETIAETYHCSECGMVKKIKTNFCGRCGADMREPEGET